MLTTCSLIPRAPSYLCSSVLCSVWMEERRKTRKRWGKAGYTYHVAWCKVDVGGQCLTTNKRAINLRTSFSLVKWNTWQSYERLKSCLATVHLMMKSSTLFKCEPLPPPHILPTSAWHHATLPLRCIITECTLENKKWGRLGNMTKLYSSSPHLCSSFLHSSPPSLPSVYIAPSPWLCPHAGPGCCSSRSVCQHDSAEERYLGRRFRRRLHLVVTVIQHVWLYTLLFCIL